MMDRSIDQWRSQVHCNQRDLGLGGTKGRKRPPIGERGFVDGGDAEAGAKPR